MTTYYDNLLNQKSKKKKEQQNPITSQPEETQTEHPNDQSTSTTQTDNKTTSELTKSHFSASSGKQPRLDNDVFNPLTTNEGNNMYLELCTNFTLITQKETSHVLLIMDFEKLTLDGLIDTGALTGTIPEADLNKIFLLSNEATKDTGPAPKFQIMVANGQLERLELFSLNAR